MTKENVLEQHHYFLWQTDYILEFISKDCRIISERNLFVGQIYPLKPK